jgi:hypothetical protein
MLVEDDITARGGDDHELLRRSIGMDVAGSIVAALISITSCMRSKS